MAIPRLGRTATWLPAIVFALWGAPALAPASDAAQGSARTADADRIIEVLQIEPGQVVAEIGAGNGELAVAVAEHLGAAGRLYATELGDGRLSGLRRALERVENAVVLAAATDRANLPEGCCDAVFMRNVYHHFDDPAAINESLFRALKPGGRLAVLDFAPRGTEARGPAGRDDDGAHGVSAETITNELKLAGFVPVLSETGNGRDVVVVVQKPPLPANR